MKGIFMDTMTYAAFAAFRGDVAEKNNQPPVYYPEKELMEVQHYLQAISLIIGKHHYRT
jgi:hypothetical protein